MGDDGRVKPLGPPTWDIIFLFGKRIDELEKRISEIDKKLKDVERAAHHRHSYIPPPVYRGPGPMTYKGPPDDEIPGRICRGF